MKTSWTQGIKDEQREMDVRVAFKSSLILRQRLAEMCGHKIMTSISTKKAQYDTPSWAYTQADLIGYRRALEEIISILED